MLFRNGITKERLSRSIINQPVKSASSLLRFDELCRRVDKESRCDGVLAWAVVVPYVSAWLVLVVVVS